MSYVICRYIVIYIVLGRTQNANIVWNLTELAQKSDHGGLWEFGFGLWMTWHLFCKKCMKAFQTLSPIYYRLWQYIVTIASLVDIRCKPSLAMVDCLQLLHFQNYVQLAVHRRYKGCYVEIHNGPYIVGFVQFQARKYVACTISLQTK